MTTVFALSDTIVAMCTETEHSQRMTVWCVYDCVTGDIVMADLPDVDLAYPARALSGGSMAQLAQLVHLSQRNWLCMNHLAVDMRQFCQLVVPHMTNVEVLEFRFCNKLTALDIALLSATLSCYAVQLGTLVLAVQDDDEVRGAIAALCFAHPSIRHVVVEGLDDSRADAISSQPYALITALLRSAAPTGLRIVDLEQTPVPTPAARLAMQPLDQDKLRNTQFFLRDRQFATLEARVQ
jgi:hypothetical protein